MHGQLTRAFMKIAWRGRPRRNTLHSDESTHCAHSRHVQLLHEHISSLVNSKVES